MELDSINGGRASDGGVDHGVLLVAFTEAVMGTDESRLAETRRALREVLSPAAFVDTAAVIGSFNVVDRIADSTGIPLDDMMRGVSQQVREELDLARFASSANTPGARAEDLAR